MKRAVSNSTRLRISSAALIDNWRAMGRASGAAAAGAAVKADGYGLGAVKVVELLSNAGCQDFFVASWQEAQEIVEAANGASLSVLHGIGPDDLTIARDVQAKPVLNSAEQIMRWRQFGDRPCDIMIDTGMNRLGLSLDQILGGITDGLNVDILMSHLACADEDHIMNVQQCEAFRTVSGKGLAKRLSMSNSAGIMLGDGWHFDLTRPGIALYGGIVRPELEGFIEQVVTPEAQIIQRRRIQAGDSVGYGASFVARQDTELATLSIGYADGYLTGFSNSGMFSVNGLDLPVVGRISMDLVTVDVTACAALNEGDWVECDYALPRAALQSGLSQYEILTSMGQRYDRYWV